MKNFKILFAVAAMFMFSQTSFAQDDVKVEKPTKEMVTDGNAECVALMKKVERRFKNATKKRPERFETEAAQVKLRERIIKNLNAQECYADSKKPQSDNDKEVINECAEAMFNSYMANKRVASKDERAALRREFMEENAEKIADKCND